jgi:hypothetical protein
VIVFVPEYRVIMNCGVVSAIDHRMAASCRNKLACDDGVSADIAAPDLTLSRASALLQVIVFVPEYRVITNCGVVSAIDHRMAASCRSKLACDDGVFADIAAPDLTLSQASLLLQVIVFVPEYRVIMNCRLRVYVGIPGDHELWGRVCDLIIGWLKVVGASLLAMTVYLPTSQRRT